MSSHTRGATVRTRILGVACAAVLLAACDNVKPPALTAPAAADTRTPTAFLAVSDSSAAPGALLVVSGNVATAAGERAVGSYRAALRFDPSQLEFVGDAGVAGAMVAMNATPGEVVLAGAAPNGFANGRLFAVRFRVRGGAPLQSLAIIVRELNDVGFANRLPVLRTKPRPSLDRTLR